MSGEVDGDRRRLETRDGPRTSTPCWPNVNGRPSVRPRRCRCSCRSARWWNSAATLTRRPSGCDAGMPTALIHMPCWAPHFTTGCSASITPSGLFDLDDLPGAVDRDARPRPRNWPNCRMRSRCRRGRPARRSTSRCRSTWSSAAGWCADASTRSSPTTTAAPPWWTGRPANRRTPRKPSGTRPFSLRCTGWRGRRCRGARSSRCARRSTTCAAGGRSSPNRLPGSRRAGRLLEAA